METKEMTLEELQTKEMTLEELRNAYEEEKESRIYWMNKAQKSEERFKTFMDAIKGVTALADK